MKSMDQNHKKLNKSRDQNLRQFWGYFLDFLNLWWKSQHKSKSMATKGC
jgi:hypothetical protein